jgi:hypothetical protein
MDYLCFAWSQSRHAASRLDVTKWLELCKEFQDEGQVPIVGPDLATVHGSNAFRQQLDRLEPAKNPLCAASKGVHHKVPLRIWNQHNRNRLGRKRLQILKDMITPHPAVLEMGADQRDIRLVFFYFANRFAEAVGDGNNIEIMPPARKSLGDQMRAHAVRIRDKDADACAERLG